MNVGKKIQEIRQKYVGISGEELAKRLNDLFPDSRPRPWNQQSISYMEIQGEPSFSEIKQIAIALDVRWTDLVSYTEIDPLLIARLKKNHAKSTT